MKKPKIAQGRRRKRLNKSENRSFDLLKIGRQCLTVDSRRWYMNAEPVHRQHRQGKEHPTPELGNSRCVLETAKHERSNNSNLPPQASIFSLALAENPWALIVSGFVRAPSLRILTLRILPAKALFRRAASGVTSLPDGKLPIDQDSRSPFPLERDYEIRAWEDAAAMASGRLQTQDAFHLRTGRPVPCGLGTSLPMAGAVSSAHTFPFFVRTLGRS